MAGGGGGGGEKKREGQKKGGGGGGGGGYDRNPQYIPLKDDQLNSPCDLLKDGDHHPLVVHALSVHHTATQMPTI